MNNIDLGFFFFLRACADRWPRLDSFMDMLTGNEVLKAAPVLVTVWGFWFIRDSRTDDRRTRIVSALVAGCGAAIFSVWLTRVLPLRLRPMFEASLSSSFAIPHGGVPDWARVSSLPSDHAAMFVALACGLIFASRKWGVLLLLHAVFFVLLPRAFVGLHYFWDLAAGALIGVLFALLCNIGFVRSRLSAPLVRIEQSHAPVFYGAMAMLTLQIADLFHGTREVLDVLRRALAALASSLAPNYQAVGIAFLSLLAIAGYVLLRKRRHRIS